MSSFQGPRNTLELFVEMFFSWTFPGKLNATGEMSTKKAFQQTIQVRSLDPEKKTKVEKLRYTNFANLNEKKSENTFKD